MTEVRYRVRPAGPLNGTAVVQGAKNAALPMIGAALLARRGQTVLRNVPAITDVQRAVDLARLLGAHVEYHPNDRLLVIDATDITSSRLRGRIVLLAGARSRPVLPAGALYMNDRSVIGFVISHASTAELAEAADAVNRMLAAGRLAPRAVVPLPLSQVAEAHRMIEQGELGGRRAVITA